MNKLKTLIIAGLLAFPHIALAETADTARSISMMCGNSAVKIECGYNPKVAEGSDWVCNNNNLTFTLKDGNVIKPPIPKLHDAGSTPMQLGCSKGSDGNYYVMVHYMFGGYDCDKCHVDELYDSNGQRIENVPFFRFLNDKKLKIPNFLRIEEVSTKPNKINQ